ncbi:MAG: TetR family transcriptional regulator [Oscillospiraceae bacterium]|nr:TetR family transcriptional regulator [Oscillospiraceae bacterium]
MKVQKKTAKEKIMETSAKLFSEKGYEKVSVREISSTAGVNSAMIYYYFASKDGVLKSLYRFYTEERLKECPDLNELLRLAETDPPHAVLMKSEFHFNEKTRKMLDQILVTASREICSDPESEHFIRENIFENITNILKPLLLRLVELEKIKPFDIDTFLKVTSYYCYSAAALNNSAFKQNVAEYQAGMSFLFSMITPI